MNEFEQALTKRFALSEQVPFAWADYPEHMSHHTNSLKPDKAVLAQEPVFFPMDEPADLPEGRFYTQIGSARLEGFYHPGTEPRLYVVFHGSRGQEGNLNPLPTFMRWSWCTQTNAHYICIEDPMYYTYPKLLLGWYYGTETENYREYTARCIRKAAEAIGVPVSGIVLYGSSGGGTAAVGISAFLSGCTVVAINPQLDFAHYAYTRKFVPLTGLPIAAEPDPLGRNNNAELIRTHTENRYLFLSNIRSKNDYRFQLPYLCRGLDMEPKMGLTRKGHVTVWLYDAAGAPNAHASVETIPIFKFIDAMLTAQGGQEEQDCMVRVINELWTDCYLEKKRAHDQRTKQNETVDALKQQLEQAQKEKAELEAKLKGKNKELKKVKESLSYRLGRMLTAIPRKLKKLFGKK